MSALRMRSTGSDSERQTKVVDCHGRRVAARRAVVPADVLGDTNSACDRSGGILRVTCGLVGHAWHLPERESYRQVRGPAVKMLERPGLVSASSVAGG